MKNTNRKVIAWAVQRVTDLHTVKRYEDSYAVSQEFCEWTNSLDSYQEGLKLKTLKVPNFES